MIVCALIAQNGLGGMCPVMMRMKKSAQLLKEPRTLAVSGILIALSVVLGVCRIQVTPELQVNFGFTAMAVIAMLFGPAVSVPAAIVCDVLSLLLNPMGSYFFGFTITAMLSSLIFSLFLFDREAPRHDREYNLGHGKDPLGRDNRSLLIRAFCAKTLINLFCNVLLNSFWLTLYYGQSMKVLLPARILKNAILLVPEVVVLFFALKAARYAWQQIARR